MLTFLEFFAGGGLARAGLGAGWRCLFANDVAPDKCAAYRANWGAEDLCEADIAQLSAKGLPKRRADLAWASFPCQDLSLAGRREGLAAKRSGLFHEFVRLIAELRAAGRAPRALVVENVAGLVTSHGGQDFRAVIERFVALGYRTGAVMLDARHFLPQSRPRLFVIGLAAETAPLAGMETPGAETPAALAAAIAGLPPPLARAWLSISAAPAPRRNLALIDLVDLDTEEWSAEAGVALLAGMAPTQRRAAEALREAGGRHLGAAYRRMRIENGARRPRWEARFDGLAGCLRTPAGGSSVQRLLKINDGLVSARALSPREAARLMGAPETYLLPASRTKALKLFGDAVAAPVVRHLAETLLEPALRAETKAA